MVLERVTTRGAVAPTGIRRPLCLASVLAFAPSCSIPDARLHVEHDAGASGSGAESSGEGGDAAADDGSATSGGSGGTGGASVDLAGRWVGLTSDQRLFDMRVFANAVTRVTFDWSVTVPVPDSNLACVASGETSTDFGTPVAIDDALRFENGPIAGDPVSYSVRGTFSTGRSAMGDINMTHAAPNCTGSSPLTWVAEHVVCGDGRLTWPETCDDENVEPDDGCSELCQLTPATEEEPNDTLAEAAAPLTTDGVLAGELSSPDDLDVFAIKNPHAGIIAVEIETHGETVGTCHVDTLIEVVDSEGALLASDDDAARAWFCSLLVHSLEAGETVYVRVGSAVGERIPSYNLHVRYPHL